MKLRLCAVLAALAGLALGGAAQIPYVEEIPNPTANGPIMPPTAIFPSMAADPGKFWQPPPPHSAQFPRYAPLLAKAQTGDVDSEFLLAEWLAGGRLGPRNYVQAAYWLQKVNTQTGGSGQIGLAAMGEYGKLLLLGRGVVMDQNQGVRLITTAAENGAHRAMATEALMYMMGWGTGVDYQNALYWLRRSTGDSQHVPFALPLRGVLYLEGWGVDQNLDKAFDYFSQAAAVGDDDGMIKLGEMYLYGIGTDADEARAESLFEQAGRTGHPFSLYCRGMIFGHGLTPDHKKNFKSSYFFYNLAARQGLPRAIGQLTDYNFRGLGRPKNISAAYHWAVIGAAHGSSIAKDELPTIEAQFNAAKAAHLKSKPSGLPPA